MSITDLAAEFATLAAKVRTTRAAHRAQQIAAWEKLQALGGRGRHGGLLVEAMADPGGFWAWFDEDGPTTSEADTAAAALYATGQVEPEGMGELRALGDRLIAAVEADLFGREP